MMAKHIHALTTVAAALVLALASRASVDAAVSCSDAVNALIPCGPYLLGQGPPDPSPQCCRSAQALNKIAASAADRSALCECMKQMGPSFGVKPERAQHLPPYCMISINIPINPNVNCNRV